MGRSVAIHPDSVAVAYRYIETEDDDGNEYWFDWEEELEFFREWITEKYPSFYSVDEAPNTQDWYFCREGVTILRSNFAEVHISSYCGCVAICLTVRSDLEDWEFPLARTWAGRIADNFEKRFGTMKPFARFSNGEVWYQRSR